MVKTANLDLQKVLLSLFFVVLALYVGKWIMYGMGWGNLESFQTASVVSVVSVPPSTPSITVPATAPTTVPAVVVPIVDPAGPDPTISVKPTTTVLLIPSIESYVTLDEAQRKKFFVEMNKKLEVALACAGNSVCQNSVREQLPVPSEVLNLFDYLLNIRGQQQFPFTYEEFDGLMKMITSGDIIL